jgi:hypothetical protein
LEHAKNKGRSGGKAVFIWMVRILAGLKRRQELLFAA